MTGAGSTPDGDHEASQSARRSARLERGYRRLLFFYPARYRQVHEEEMLAVLMTAAPAGKRRPGIADAADLIWAALRVRFQPQRASGEPAWRDALAVLSVISPILLLFIYAAQEIQFPLNLPARSSYGFPLSGLQGPVLMLALVAAVLLRLRRTAAVAAGVMLLWVAFLSGVSTYIWATSEAYLFVPLVLEIVALAASPGPRRGLQILTWTHGALLVIAALAVAASHAAIFSYPVTLIVLAVIAAAMVLTSSLGRWLLVLLVIAFWPSFLPSVQATPWEFYLPHGLGVVGQVYLVPAALLGVFAVLARRTSRRWGGSFRLPGQSPDQGEPPPDPSR
jgi:hypothetical protein